MNWVFEDEKFERAIEAMIQADEARRARRRGTCASATGRRPTSPISRSTRAATGATRRRHRSSSTRDRQALRLVAEEVRTMWAHTDDLVNEGRFPNVHPPSRTFLPCELWMENRAILARHLDDESWDALSPFMDSVPAARAIVEVAELNALIPEATRARFATMRDLAAELYSALSGGDTIDAH